MRTIRLTILAPIALCSVAMAQTNTGDTYVPGVTYQSTNPNYFQRNPFYFEGRIDWNLLKITTPANAWEFVQSGIHNQEDLEDIPSAIADYRKALAQNSLGNNTCQLITADKVKAGFGQNTNPPPCMFTPRLRLATLLEKTDPQSAIGLFQEVLTIDPLRLGVHAAIGESFVVVAAAATTAAAKETALESALDEFQKELDLSPVTADTIKLTGDKANNSHVHWSMAEIYHEMGKATEEAIHLQAYLDASQWHSDTYPWRIPLARARLSKLAVK